MLLAARGPVYAERDEHLGLIAASSDPRSARRQLSSLRTSRSLRAKASGWPGYPNSPPMKPP